MTKQLTKTKKKLTCTCRTHSWIQIIGLLLGLDDGAHTKECNLIRFRHKKY